MITGLNTKKEDFKRPSLLLFLSEAGRAVTELGLNIPYSTLRKNKNKGDGHPVFVLPGFLSGDYSTGPLRRCLNKAGYNAIPWNLGRNYAGEEKIALLAMQLEEIYEEYGEEVSIIGWSLGGIYARQIAKAKPHLVRQVITLGSPFADITAPTNVSWIYKIVAGGKTTKDIDPALLADIPKPVPVPSTAIYSKEDGVVPWRACIEKKEHSWHQNIQVRGSHFGLGVNASVRTIILDRLQQPKEDWQHFQAKSFFDDWVLYPSLSA